MYEEPYNLLTNAFLSIFPFCEKSERLCMPLLVDELGLYLSASVSLCFCVFAGSGET